MFVFGYREEDGRFCVWYNERRIESSDLSEAVFAAFDQYLADLEREAEKKQKKGGSNG